MKTETERQEAAMLKAKQFVEKLEAVSDDTDFTDDELESLIETETETKENLVVSRIKEYVIHFNGVDVSVTYNCGYQWSSHGHYYYELRKGKKVIEKGNF